MIKVWWNRMSTKIIRKLKSSKMKLFNIWSWPAELIDDIRTWSIVRSALKEDMTKSILDSFKYKIRIDKIGRLYTVINVPEEFYPQDKQKLVQYWLVEQLRDIDEILMQCNLNEFLYPLVERIQDEESFAYLIILTPPSESLSIWKFLFWIFNLGLYWFSIYIINGLLIKFVGMGGLDLFNLLF